MTRAGFETGFVSLSDRFYRVAFYLLEDREKALDAVQDLFLKLWKMRDMLDGVRNPEAFGIVMIRNLCLDQIRRESRTEPLRGDFLEEKGPEETAFDAREDLRKLHRALDALPEKQRNAFRERVLRDRSYEEIAAETGLTPLHVRVLVSGARKNLKKQLEYENN
ncbi:MAG: RNA polymerase sigma factor [Bacteroidales bacterium]|nr:RNA polymerase sigma factor [Bacteroidales bacterium]